MVEQVAEKHGRLDILVKNAGITKDGLLMRMSDADFDDVIRVNLKSAFVACRAASRPMMKGRFGRIVNVGSVSGLMGNAGQVNYAAAKSGIHGFTKALAQEGAAKGITVNAIAPGYIDTEMVQAVPADVLKKIIARIPVGRLGHAAEIARGVVFLVADEGAFITGSTLSINGGQHMY
jgi:acetoacetyl-CoA reductase